MGIDKQPGRTIYRIRFQDHRRIHRTMPGFRSKSASEALHRNLCRLAELVSAGAMIPDDMITWLDKKLPDKRRNKLIEWGLIDRQRLMAKRSLHIHMKEWRQHMLDKNTTEEHAEQEYKRVNLLLEPFITYGDIDPELVQNRLALLAKLGGTARGKPWSRLTQRHYLSAAKAFCNWMVRFGRHHHNPLKVLPLSEVPRKMYGKQRRALSNLEIVDLLVATRDSGVTRGGMDGPERSLFYRFAIETGYRASVIHEMQVKHLHLDDDPPWIEAPKIRRDQGGHKTRTDIPISNGLVAELKPHIYHKLPESKLFKGPSVSWYSDILKSDLRIANIDTAGLDFHAFRHTRATQLVRAGVPIEHARDLLGHQKIETTVDIYSHIGRRELVKTIANLPEIILPNLEP